MNIVETKNLGKRYGDTWSVQGLNMKVPEAAVYGFLGPNGAGKTTTLKMLLGLAHPTQGEVTLFGQPMNRQNRLATLRAMGSLIESPSYYANLTGLENLRVVARLRQLSESDCKDALKTVHLMNARDKRAGAYSLGMKQRLGLAMALLGRPKLLLVDEPTNGLDPAGIGEMRALIKSLPQTQGTTVVISSHLLSEIEQMADSIGIICQGKMVYQDSLAALSSMSRHELRLKTSDNAKAAGLLRAGNINVRREEDLLALPLLSDARVIEMTRYLMQHNVTVLRLSEWQRSLEDVFLSLTGEVAP